jgi:hypothetical protein
MPTSSIVDLALGLIFVFAATAALSSVMTELIARFLGLKGQYLLRGLRELVDGNGAEATVLADAEQANYVFRTSMKSTLDASGAAADSAATKEPANVHDIRATVPQKSATTALLGSPLLVSPGMVGLLSSRAVVLTPSASLNRPADMSISGKDFWRQKRRSLPSYFAPRAFATGVIDMVLPDATGHTSMATIKAAVNAIPDEYLTLRLSLQSLAKAAGNDVGSFRLALEKWYDEHMKEVSGWYKRRVAKITLVVGAILVILLNVNAIAIARVLYTQDDVRAAISAVASSSTQCPPDETQADCLKRVRSQLTSAAESGLPLGWLTVSECAEPGSNCTFWEQRGIVAPHEGPGLPLLLLILGFAITITALVPGARFWYDLLGKLGSLSTSGPKPSPPGS